jgi:hypothetical protein
MSVDLLPEYMEALDLAAHPPFRARLKQLGFTSPDSTGAIGLARVAVSVDGFFEPDPGGPMAIIIPAFDGPIANPAQLLDDRERLIDLVAWQARLPQQISTRCGIASVLGGEAVRAATHGEGALRLFRSPASWARAGGATAGAVVLDWKTDIGLLAAATIIAEDLEHGGEVKRKLKELRARQIRQVPSIRVPEKAGAA